MDTASLTLQPASSASLASAAPGTASTAGAVSSRSGTASGADRSKAQTQDFSGAMREADQSQGGQQAKPREAREHDDAADKSQDSAPTEHRPRVRADRRTPARAREDRDPAGAQPPHDGKTLPPDAAKLPQADHAAEENADSSAEPAADEAAATATAAAAAAATGPAAAAALIDLVASGAAQAGKDPTPPAIALPMAPSSPAAAAPAAAAAAPTPAPADAPPPLPLLESRNAANLPIPAAITQLLRESKAELADRKLPAMLRPAAEGAAGPAAGAANTNASAASLAPAVGSVPTAPAIMSDLLQRLQGAAAADGVLDAAASATPRPHVEAARAAPATVPAAAAVVPAALDAGITAAFSGALAAADAPVLPDKAATAPAPAAPDPQPVALANAPASTSSAPAAAPAPTFRLSPGLDTPEFSQALGERIAWLVDKDIGAAKLSINPPQLGPIDVHIEVSGDKAQVLLSAHSVVTRETLEAASPRLRDMLGAQGFSQVNVDVSQRSFQERGAPAPRQEWLPAVRDSAPSTAFVPEAAPRRSLPGALDAYA